MNLISFEFLGFMMILFAVYHLLDQPIYHKVVILIANLVFYYYFIMNDFTLLMAMIFVSYALSSITIKGKRVNRKLFIVSVTFLCIGILAYYKYLYLIVDTVNALLKTHWVLNKTIIAPLGLSFYTFKILSYCFDVYYGKQEPVSFLDYFNYVTFFAQFASGPIERIQTFLQSINIKKPFDYVMCRNGFVMILMGIFEKMVFSDNITQIINTLLAQENRTASMTLVFIFLYSLNIYFDFDAYSNIAVGCANCIMIDTPANFKTPYMAVSIKDFWNRWHISLSKWFTSYIYISLGGNRKGKLKQYRNIIIVFLVSGLWHGAAYNYILWGLIHGLLRVAEDVITSFIKIKNKIALFVIHFFSRILTFILVSYAWVFFRITDAKEAILLIKESLPAWKNFDFSFEMLGYSYHEKLFIISLIIIFIIVEIIRYVSKGGMKWLGDRSILFRWTVYAVMIVCFVIFAVYGKGYDPNYFTYFEF